MFLQNFMNLPHPAAELLRSVNKFKMAAVGHLELFLATWTTHEVFLLTGSLCSNFVSIGFIFPKISPMEHFASLA